MEGTRALQKIPELKNGGFIRQMVKLQARKVPHGIDFVGGVCHAWGDKVIKS
jgi:hypothetical protein